MISGARNIVKDYHIWQKLNYASSTNHIFLIVNVNMHIYLYIVYYKEYISNLDSIVLFR